MKFWAGLVWAVGAAEKKNFPTAISMQLFGVVFSTFCEQKKKLNLKNIYFSIRTEKLHSIKAKKIFKKIEKYFILG